MSFSTWSVIDLDKWIKLYDYVHFFFLLLFLLDTCWVHDMWYIDLYKYHVFSMNFTSSSLLFMLTSSNTTLSIFFDVCVCVCVCVCVYWALILFNYMTEKNKWEIMVIALECVCTWAFSHCLLLHFKCTLWLFDFTKLSKNKMAHILSHLFLSEEF